MRCSSGKQRYRSQDAAENVLRSMTRSKQWVQRCLSGHHELRAYHCQRCEGWHLTSQARRQAA
jgi:hypothetical protein